MKPVLYFLLTCFLISCSASKKTTGTGSATVSSSASSSEVSGGDGSSFENAVIINEKSETPGVHREYEWLREHYPGYKLKSQALSYKDNKPYDVMSIVTKNGEEKKIYFDISNFFGKF